VKKHSRQISAAVVLICLASNCRNTFNVLFPPYLACWHQWRAQFF
jgi:hypothetical protein